MKRPGRKGRWELIIGGNFVTVGAPGHRADMRKRSAGGGELAIADIEYNFGNRFRKGPANHKRAVALGGFIVIAGNHFEQLVKAARRVMKHSHPKDDPAFIGVENILRAIDNDTKMLSYREEPED